MAGRTKENNDNRVAAHQQREMQKWGAIGEDSVSVEET
jgi:hypothetical protein